MEKIKTVSKFRSEIKTIGYYAVLVILSLFLMLPLIVLLGTSFKEYEDVIVNAGKILPEKVTFDNYKYVLSEFNFLYYTGNTLIIVIGSTFGTVASSAFCAYGFIRYDVKLKNILFVLFFACAMIPGQVLSIPIYEVYYKLNWIDTYFPFIVPTFFGGGIFNVFLIMQFFRAIPKSVFESAEIDGAGEFRIFLTFVVPLSVPVLITIGIFTCIGAWNDFFGPLIYLNSQRKYTLALAIYEIIYHNNLNTGSGTTQWNLVAAANLICMLPLFVIFAFGQKFFMSGINFGSAVKG